MTVTEELPYRGPGRTPTAAGRPATIALPPDRLARWLAGRPLKRWRYVGAYGDDVMLCVGDVHVGPTRQTFWAVWDREARTLHERTGVISHRHVDLGRPGRVRAGQGGVSIDLELDEQDGVETVCGAGKAYTWTRKQGGIAIRGEIELAGRRRRFEGRGVIDDSAGYHPRETRWCWSAGVGRSNRGQRLAWNLVVGINDPPSASERSLWVDGVAREVDPVRFDEDLGGIAFASGERLAFEAEATRARADNLILLRSDYEQPFGRFSGSLPGPIVVAEGFGVMERHLARW